MLFVALAKARAPAMVIKAVLAFAPSIAFMAFATLMRLGEAVVAQEGAAAGMSAANNTTTATAAEGYSSSAPAATDSATSPLYSVAMAVAATWLLGLVALVVYSVVIGRQAFRPKRIASPPSASTGGDARVDTYDGTTWVSYIPLWRAAAIPDIFIGTILPDGFWINTGFAKMHGAAFGMLSGKTLVEGDEVDEALGRQPSSATCQSTLVAFFSSLNLALTICFSANAAFDYRRAWGDGYCWLQHAVSALIFFARAALVLSLRPHRSRLLSSLSGTSCVLLGIVSALSSTGVLSTTSTTSARAVSLCLTAAMGLSSVSGILGIGLMLADRFRWRPAWRNMYGQAGTAASTGDEDNMEMQLLHVPGANVSHSGRQLNPLVTSL